MNASEKEKLHKQITWLATRLLFNSGFIKRTEDIGEVKNFPHSGSADSQIEASEQMEWVEDLGRIVEQVQLEIVRQFEAGSLTSKKWKQNAKTIVGNHLLLALKEVEERYYTPPEKLLQKVWKTRGTDTGQRYKGLAKYELYEEVKELVKKQLTDLSSSQLENVVNYFFDKFIEEKYELISSKGRKVTLKSLFSTFSNSDLTKGLKYDQHIEEIPDFASLVAFLEDEVTKRPSKTGFLNGPIINNVILELNYQREYYQSLLIQCRKPSPEIVKDELTRLVKLQDDKHEPDRCSICIALAYLKRESKRKLENLLSFFIYVFSNFPSDSEGEVPPHTSIHEATLNMIQGQNFTWKEVCTTFKDTPDAEQYAIKTRIQDDVKQLVKRLKLS